MENLGVPLLNVLGWIFLAIGATVIGLIVRRYAWACVQRIRIGWLRLCTLLLPPDERARQIAWVRCYLAEQFAEQRANGESPPEIAVDVLFKGLKDAPAEVCELASRAAGLAPLLLDGVLRRMFPRLFRRRVDGVVLTGTPFVVLASPSQQAPTDDEFLRIRQSNQAMMESANQVIRQNAALRERAYRIAMDTTGAQNPSVALLHSELAKRSTTEQRPPSLPWDGPKLAPAEVSFLPDTTG
jgi:hypothetical protein